MSLLDKFRRWRVDRQEANFLNEVNNFVDDFQATLEKRDAGRYEQKSNKGTVTTRGVDFAPYITPRPKPDLPTTLVEEESAECPPSGAPTSIEITVEIIGSASGCEGTELIPVSGVDSATGDLAPWVANDAGCCVSQVPSGDIQVLHTCPESCAGGFITDEDLFMTMYTGLTWCPDDGGVWELYMECSRNAHHTSICGCEFLGFSESATLGADPTGDWTFSFVATTSCSSITYGVSVTIS